MTALEKMKQADNVLVQAIDNIVTHIGEKAYQHYLLAIEESKSTDKEFPLFLDLTGSIDLWDMFNKNCGDIRKTPLGDRYVYTQFILGSIDKLKHNHMSYIVKNILDAIDEAKKLFDYKEFVCYSICFNETSLSFENFYDMITLLVGSEISPWRAYMDVDTKTISIFNA